MADPLITKLRTQLKTLSSVAVAPKKPALGLGTDLVASSSTATGVSLPLTLLSPPITTLDAARVLSPQQHKDIFDQLEIPREVPIKGCDQKITFSCIDLLIYLYLQLGDQINEIKIVGSSVSSTNPNDFDLKIVVNDDCNITRIKTLLHNFFNNCPVEWDNQKLILSSERATTGRAIFSIANIDLDFISSSMAVKQKTYISFRDAPYISILDLVKKWSVYIDKSILLKISLPSTLSDGDYELSKDYFLTDDPDKIYNALFSVIRICIKYQLSLKITLGNLILFLIKETELLKRDSNLTDFSKRLETLLEHFQVTASEDPNLAYTKFYHQKEVLCALFISINSVPLIPPEQLKKINEIILDNILKVCFLLFDSFHYIHQYQIPDQSDFKKRYETLFGSTQFAKNAYLFIERLIMFEKNTAIIITEKIASLIKEGKWFEVINELFDILKVLPPPKTDEKTESITPLLKMPRYKNILDFIMEIFNNIEKISLPTLNEIYKSFIFYLLTEAIKTENPTQNMENFSLIERFIYQGVPLPAELLIPSNMFDLKEINSKEQLLPNIMKNITDFYKLKLSLIDVTSTEAKKKINKIFAEAKKIFSKLKSTIPMPDTFLHELLKYRNELLEKIESQSTSLKNKEDETKAVEEARFDEPAGPSSIEPIVQATRTTRLCITDDDLVIDAAVPDTDKPASIVTESEQDAEESPKATTQETKKDPSLNRLKKLEKKRKKRQAQFATATAKTDEPLAKLEPKPESSTLSPLQKLAELKNKDPHLQGLALNFLLTNFEEILAELKTKPEQKQKQFVINIIEKNITLNNDQLINLIQLISAIDGNKYKDLIEALISKLHIDKVKEVNILIIMEKLLTFGSHKTEDSAFIKLINWFIISLQSYLATWKDNEEIIGKLRLIYLSIIFPNNYSETTYKLLEAIIEISNIAQIQQLILEISHSLPGFPLSFDRPNNEPTYSILNIYIEQTNKLARKIFKDITDEEILTLDTSKNTELFFQLKDFLDTLYAKINFCDSWKKKKKSKNYEYLDKDIFIKAYSEIMIMFFNKLFDISPKIFLDFLLNQQAFKVFQNKDPFYYKLLFSFVDEKKIIFTLDEEQSQKYFDICQDLCENIISSHNRFLLEKLCEIITITSLNIRINSTFLQEGLIHTLVMRIYDEIKAWNDIACVDTSKQHIISMYCEVVLSLFNLFMQNPKLKSLIFEKQDLMKIIVFILSVGFITNQELKKTEREFLVTLQSLESFPLPFLKEIFTLHISKEDDIEYLTEIIDMSFTGIIPDLILDELKSIINRVSEDLKLLYLNKLFMYLIISCNIDIYPEFPKVIEDLIKLLTPAGVQLFCAVLNSSYNGKVLSEVKKFRDIRNRNHVLRKILIINKTLKELLGLGDYFKEVDDPINEILCSQMDEVGISNRSKKVYLDLRL